MYKVAAESDNNDCNFDPKIKNTRDYLNKPFADLNTDERNAGRPDILKTTGYRYLDIEPAQRDPAWGITADNDDDNPLSQTFHSPGTGRSSGQAIRSLGRALNSVLLTTLSMVLTMAARNHGH